MTRRTLFTTALLCALCAAAAVAADISGNWSGTLQAGGDGIPLTVTFKQEGEKLTGTVTHPNSAPLTLHEGKVSGDKVSFFVMADMNGTPTKFTCQGVIKGDDITLNISGDGGMDFGATPLKRIQ